MHPRYFELVPCDCGPRKSIGGIWNSTSAVAGTTGSSRWMWLHALPHRNRHRQISLRHLGPTAAMQRDRTMLVALPRTVGNHVMEALSKMHPKGASVASLRLFTIIGIRTHGLSVGACAPPTGLPVLHPLPCACMLSPVPRRRRPAIFVHAPQGGTGRWQPSL